MVTSLARILDTLPCKTIADFAICGIPIALALKDATAMSSTTLARAEAEAEGRISGQSGATSVDTSLGAISLTITDDLYSLKGIWEDLQVSSPCTGAQSYDWARAWARHVLGPQSARPVVVVGYGCEGQPLFLWPFETTKVAGLAVLKWLSQDHANYCMGLFEPGTAQRFTGSDLSRLLREVGRAAGVAAASLKKQPFAWDGVPNPFAQIPHLPATDYGFAATLGDFKAIYMTRISGHARGLLGRTERRIAEHGPLAYGWAETQEDRLQILDTLIAQKTRQLAEMGVKNMFDANISAFYREIALLEGDNPSRLRLGYLKAGDAVLATHNGTICHNRLMITLSSRTDGQLKRYSPGSLLLRHQIEGAAAKGLAFYDLGLGTASYKEKWCDVVEPLFDCCVAFKPHGALLTLALNSGAHAKRFVKSNPRVYEFAKKMRRALRGNQASPD